MIVLRILFEVVPIILAAICVVYSIRKYQYSVAYKKLNELLNSPFSFRLSDGNGDGYIVFKFEKDIELFCDYKFGIRCDGLYGIAELTVKGINGSYARSLQLKIGQSIFPIIENMMKFDKWAKDQAFEYKWEKDFTEEWDKMKSKLNNLRILEAKSKEKEKKSK